MTNMKKILYSTPIVTLVIILVMFTNYEKYNDVNQLTIMIFWILPILLNIIILGIAVLLEKEKKD